MAKIEFGGTMSKYGCFSNFYPCFIEYEGLTYGSTEAAFQAAKTSDIVERTRFTVMPPSEAKRAGRRVKLRPDWEQVKDNIMYELVLTKFSKYEDIKKVLLSTGDDEIVEVTTWHDLYWGVCGCPNCQGGGKNMLGKILMRVRDELREKENSTNV